MGKKIAMGGKVGIEMELERIEPECSGVEVERVVRNDKTEMVIGKLMGLWVVLDDECDRATTVICGIG